MANVNGKDRIESRLKNSKWLLHLFAHFKPKKKVKLLISKLTGIIGRKHFEK
jgi:hypothetical protein